MKSSASSCRGRGLSLVASDHLPIVADIRLGINGSEKTAERAEFAETTKSFLLRDSFAISPFVLIQALASSNGIVEASTTLGTVVSARRLFTARASS